MNPRIAFAGSLIVCAYLLPQPRAMACDQWYQHQYRLLGRSTQGVVILDWFREYHVPCEGAPYGTTQATLRFVTRDLVWSARHIRVGVVSSTKSRMEAQLRKRALRRARRIPGFEAWKPLRRITCRLPEDLSGGDSRAPKCAPLSRIGAHWLTRSAKKRGPGPRERIPSHHPFGSPRAPFPTEIDRSDPTRWNPALDFREGKGWEVHNITTYTVPGGELWVLDVNCLYLSTGLWFSALAAWPTGTSPPRMVLSTKELPKGSALSERTMVGKRSDMQTPSRQAGPMTAPLTKSDAEETPNRPAPHVAADECRCLLERIPWLGWALLASCALALIAIGLRLAARSRRR